MKKADSFVFRKIGMIYTPFKTASGTPIQSSAAFGVEGYVEVFEKYREGLSDLDGFERIWLLYMFDRSLEYKSRVIPYLDARERGLFATRAPSRPNPIGISCVRLLAVEGNILRIMDVDMLDNTPLLDIKPYAPRFDHFDVKRCGWLDKVKKQDHTADNRFEKE